MQIVKSITALMIFGSMPTDRLLRFRFEITVKYVTRFYFLSTPQN